MPSEQNKARRWHYFRDGELVGPLSTDELRVKAASGEIIPDTGLLEEGGKCCEAWELKGLFTGWWPWLNSTGGHIGTLFGGVLALAAGLGAILTDEPLASAVFYFVIAIGCLLAFARSMLKRRRLE